MRTAALLIAFLLAYPASIAKDSPVTPPKAPARAKAIHTVATVSRGAERVYLGEFEVTAYCLRGETKSGVMAGPGRVAVDRTVIPLGTRLYLQGYGECVAVDTGRLIVNRKIDVWFSTGSECDQFGRRKHVKVWRE